MSFSAVKLSQVRELLVSSKKEFKRELKGRKNEVNYKNCVAYILLCEFREHFPTVINITYLFKNSESFVSKENVYSAVVRSCKSF